MYFCPPLTIICYVDFNHSDCVSEIKIVFKLVSWFVCKNNLFVETNMMDLFNLLHKGTIFVVKFALNTIYLKIGIERFDVKYITSVLYTV